MADPALDLANHYITTLGLVGGEDVFAGEILPPGGGVKDQAVFIMPTGGPPPQITMGPASSDVNTSSVQVMIRGDVQDPGATRAFAETVRAATHKAVIAGYMAVLVNEPKATQMKRDQTDHPRFLFNAEMWHQGA